MRTKVPLRHRGELRSPRRRTGRDPSSGPRPQRRLRAPPGPWPGPAVTQRSCGPRVRPIGWTMSPPVPPANRSPPPTPMGRPANRQTPRPAVGNRGHPRPHALQPAPEEALNHPQALRRPPPGSRAGHLPVRALRPRGSSLPRGRSPDRAGYASQPGLRGQWASRDAGEVRTRPLTFERQRRCRGYGRAQTPRPRGETAQPSRGVCAMALRIHAQH
jgi:hypothetical protein